jgi:hypothetical protein
MNKRILSIMIAVLMCVALFPLSAVAAASTTATYADGVVAVDGTGFASGTSYTVRVVDTANSSIKAMGQAVANGSGSISASIITGALGTLSNYTVYVNKPDGTLAGSFTFAGGNSGDNDSDSDSDSSSGDTSGSTTTTVTNTGITISSITITTVIIATIDPITGIATAKLDEGVLNTLIASVKAAEASGQKVLVVFTIDAPSSVNGVILEIPRDAFGRLASGTNADIKFDTNIGTITFNSGSVATISGSANGGNIFISINKIKYSAMTPEAQTKVGDRPVYEFSVKAGSSEITNFFGNAEISIPYALKSGEKKNNVIVYYINSEGKIKTIRGKFVSASGLVNFKTTHFSQFAVGYNEVTFSDVAANAWYNEAVGFMSARSIVNGVGGGRFDPGNNVTRADFLVMVMNAYDIELDTAIADNFTDAGNKYYTQYLATAKRLGLVNGVGKNKYAPETSISRQDMFVTLYRALDKLGELPAVLNSGKALINFNDADQIATYARDAMKLFVETGTVAGNGMRLTPKATSTRAQAAQVLYNLLSK